MAEFSAFSPDDKQIAYTWLTPAGAYDLRVVGADGSRPRVLYRDEEAVSHNHRGNLLRGAGRTEEALNDYRQVGGGGYTMLRGAPVVYDQQQVIRQLLIEEVQKKGVLRPEDYFIQNWRLAPDSIVGAAYRSMRRLPFDRPATPRR